MMKNIVLIGMPAAGKSKVSLELSKRLKMIRYDIDDIIEGYELKTVNEIFEKKGEDYFRKIESNIVKKISMYKSIIISTGEGTIFEKNNLKYLKRNSIIFLIERNIDKIYNSNHSRRPFLKDDKSLVYDLYNDRINFYRNAADYIIINNDENIENVINEIINIYNKINFKLNKIRK